MPNVRMHPPGAGGSLTIAGRLYTTPLGTPLDVPDFDALVLEANGWIKTADAVGATAARPSAPVKGQKFSDTTTAAVIFWDGKVWRNVQTGATV